MKTRPLKWEDLKVEVCMCLDAKNSVCPDWKYIPHKDRSGRTKVHASLIGCSFVSKSFWFENYDASNPVQRASILIQLQSILRKTVHRLKAYEQI